MLTTNRTQKVYLDILDAFNSAQEVYIASAYVSPGGCSMLGLDSLVQRIPVRIVIGKIGKQGTSPGTYKYLSELHSSAKLNSGGITVADPSFHSKIYLALFPNDQKRIWVGSSNLSASGLRNEIEATVELAPSAIAETLYNECITLWESGADIDSVHIPINKKVKYKRRARKPRKSKKPFQSPKASNLARESLPEEPDIDSLEHLSVQLAPQGSVPTKSGPNWWNGAGRVRDDNEAYLPLRKHNVAKASVVFGSSSPGTIFTVITHDGEVLEMQLEGTQNGGMIAKNIASAGDKRIFGDWLLRKVLSIEKGSLLTVAYLNQYGRREISFYRLGENPITGKALVYMDFSSCI